MACTCPHHVHRNAFCKHMAAVENAIDDGTLTAFPSGDEDGTEPTTASVFFIHDTPIDVLGYHRPANAQRKREHCDR